MKRLSRKTIIDAKSQTDVPLRLFRALTDQMGVAFSSWKTYLDDYIRYVHPDNLDNMETVKKERSTTIGNVNEALWMSPKLSFGKMLTGLKILKVKRLTITLKVETESGKTFVVEEVTNMSSTKEK